MPSNVNSYGGQQHGGDQPRYGQQNQENLGGQRRKNRVFTPVTMRMIQEASPRPDDVCEIDGEAIQDVSFLQHKLCRSLSLAVLSANRKNPCAHFSKLMTIPASSKSFFTRKVKMKCLPR